MVDTLKSASITNDDASPVVANTTGNGGSGFQKVEYDYVTPTTGGLGSTSSTYRMIRVPTSIKLNSLVLTADAALDTSTGLVLDVGAYYSDATNDGTAPANQGALISATCFASAIAFQSTFANVNALSNFAVANRQLPLWDALGIGDTVGGVTVDPGGFVDIVVAVHTAATTAASHNLQLRAEFVVA